MVHQRLSTEPRQRKGLNTWVDWSCDRGNETQVTGVIGTAGEQEIPNQHVRPLGAARIQNANMCLRTMTGPLPLGTSPDVPREVRVSGMKVPSEVYIENIPCWNPGTFLCTVSFPVNQVLQPAANLTGIHNTADGEGWSASNNTGGRGCFRGRGKRRIEYRA